MLHEFEPGYFVQNFIPELTKNNPSDERLGYSFQAIEESLKAMIEKKPHEETLSSGSNGSNYCNYDARKNIISKLKELLSGDVIARPDEFKADFPAQLQAGFDTIKQLKLPHADGSKGDEIRLQKIKSAAESFLTMLTEKLCDAQPGLKESLKANGVFTQKVKGS